MLSRLLSSLPPVVSGGLVGLIVALGFQVLPDINLGGDPTVFNVHEFLATIVIIVLIVLTWQMGQVASIVRAYVCPLVLVMMKIILQIV